MTIGGLMEKDMIIFAWIIIFGYVGSFIWIFLWFLSRHRKSKGKIQTK